MAATDTDLSSVVFMAPDWVAMNVISQSAGFADREFENLSNRQRFEAALTRQVGLQYVVAHDPLESKAKYKGPDGEEQSDVWVIQRHTRRSKDDVTITGYYYIMNQAIFQAPTVANILSYRLLNATVAINEVLSAASKLPLFTTSHGHTYYKPTQKTTSTSAAVAVQGKDATPAPETQTSTTDKSETTTGSKVAGNVGSKTLQDALSMSMRYGREYMDDMPLTGEPGAFRFAKVKDSLGPSQSLSNSQVTSSKTGTPAPVSRAGSPPPPIQTDVPAVSSKKSAVKTPGGDNPVKPKRRKSKPALSPEA